MSWRGYSSYGKSALGVQISLNGLDQYLQKIQDAGNDINGTCKDAVNAALPIVKKAMKDGAARHTKGVGKYGTGAVENAIETTPAKADGNYVYGEVGIDTAKHSEAAHAVFQELGDGHSPEFPDPFVRPAFDEHKAEVRSAERAVLKKGGIPIE